MKPGTGFLRRESGALGLQFNLGPERPAWRGKLVNILILAAEVRATARIESLVLQFEDVVSQVLV